MKNLGNFTKNAKNRSEKLTKLKVFPILIDFSLIHFANFFFKICEKLSKQLIKIAFALILMKISLLNFANFFFQKTRKIDQNRFYFDFD